MSQYRIHPWVSQLALVLKQWGWLQLFSLTTLLIIVASGLIALAFSLTLHNRVDWDFISGALLFAVVAAPPLVSACLYLIKHLDATLFYLQDSARQEKRLNENLQENIRQLNFEIEERKKAFQAKRQAVDELRKEITERKKTQLLVEEQSLLMKSIVDSSPDLFYYRDETGRFASCNKMFERMIGKSSSELIGHYPSEIYAPDMAPAAILTDHEVSVNQAELTLDVEYNTPDGQLMWFEMRKVPFFDRQGRYIGLLGFGRDITSRKMAEQALERAYQDKGKFIATLSHELRTPLNGIVGLTRRLLETRLSDEQRSWANTIFSSAETLGNIFNDIIDLDKIDRQDLDILYQSTDIAQFILDIANFAELICQQKGLNFKLQQVGELQGHLKLDPTRVRQVLWNLLSNAVKFTARGEISLYAELCHNELIFVVSDTGIGISVHEQQRIFDMYYKSSDGRRLSIVGSGIGLSVSKALVEAMGGSVTVQSQLNQGSHFTVRLPTELQQAPELSQLLVCPELTVLLVEDVPLNAEIATNLLEQRGHTVVHAETGEDALALLETEDDIDLVLLDMQLPDMTGDQIARFMQQEPHLAQIPIVVLSANVRKAEQQLEGIQIAGALAKPINTNKLDQVLARLFSPSAVRQSQSQSTDPDDNEPADTVLDTPTLQDYLQSLGKAPMQRSMQLFQQLVPGYVNKMVEAATMQQLQEFQDAAHKLKGAAASVGLLWVQQQAKQLEQLEQPNWPAIERQLIEFHLTIDTHLQLLAEYLAAYEG